MMAGVPKVKKKGEYRGVIMPVGVEEMVKNGHGVILKEAGGIGSGISDSDYEKAGAIIIEDAAYIFENVEIIMEVKEPLPEEYQRVRKGQYLK